MKNFSLPRLAVVLWFFWFVVRSLSSYVMVSGRHFIMDDIVISAALLALTLLGLGLIEDIF